MKHKIYTIGIIAVVIGAGYYLFSNKNTVYAPKDKDQSMADIICPSDVMACPNGTSVSRIAPTCDFAPCPIKQTVKPKTTTVTPTVKKTTPVIVPEKVNPLITNQGDALNPSVAVFLNETGFEPRSLSISLGKTVRFINHHSSSTMWIISDPHPTHTAYPALNEKVAVPSGGIFEFIFNKAGTWKYHNESDPTKTGTIIVK